MTTDLDKKRKRKPSMYAKAKEERVYKRPKKSARKIVESDTSASDENGDDNDFRLDGNVFEVLYYNDIFYYWLFFCFHRCCVLVCNNFCSNSILLLYSYQEIHQTSTPLATYSAGVQGPCPSPSKGHHKVSF